MFDGWDQFKNRLGNLKDLGSIGVADLVGGGVSAFFWFYIASVLEPEQYGEINYFLGIASLAAYISLIGTQNTITVYTAKNVKTQSTLYLISLVIGTISSLAIIFIFYRIDVAIVLFGYIINTLSIGDLLGRKLYSSYTKYILIQKGLTLVLGIGFYYAFGVDGIIYALTLSYIAYTIRIYKGLKDSKIDFLLLRSRLGFITNNYVIGLVVGFAGQIDKLIIAPLLGFVLLGNYSLALQMVAVLMLFSGIIFKYILAHDATGIQNIKLKQLTIIMSIGITIIGIFLFPIIISMFFPKYIQVIDAIQIMSLSIVPAYVTMIYSSKFLGLEKSKFVLVGSSISLVIIIVAIISLGSLFGIKGAAIAFVLSTTANATFLVVSDRFIMNK